MAQFLEPWEAAGAFLVGGMAAVIDAYLGFGYGPALLVAVALLLVIAVIDVKIEVSVPLIGTDL